MARDNLDQVSDAGATDHLISAELVVLLIPFYQRWPIGTVKYAFSPPKGCIFLKKNIG